MNSRKNYFKIYAIKSNTDIISELDALNRKIDLEFHNGIPQSLNYNDLRKYLRATLNDINFVIEDTYSYIEENYFKDNVFKELLKGFKTLIEKKYSYTLQLKKYDLDKVVESTAYYNAISYISDKKRDTSKEINFYQFDKLKKYHELIWAELQNKRDRKHDSNIWNEQCFDLFLYLFENYYDGKTKKKLTNIWFGE